MKNFAIYSKNGLKKKLSVKEIEDIRFVKGGLRLIFLIDILGIFYFLYRRFYVLALIAFCLFVIFEVLFFYLPLYENLISNLKLATSFIFIIFGREMEEFFLSKKGYQVRSFEFAKTEKEAILKLEERLNVKL